MRFYQRFSCPGPPLYFGDQESGVADLISQITEDQTKKNCCCFHGEAWTMQRSWALSCLLQLDRWLSSLSWEEGEPIVLCGKKYKAIWSLEGGQWHRNAITFLNCFIFYLGFRKLHFPNLLHMAVTIWLVLTNVIWAEMMWTCISMWHRYKLLFLPFHGDLRGYLLRMAVPRDVSTTWRRASKGTTQPGTSTWDLEWMRNELLLCSATKMWGFCSF